MKQRGRTGHAGRAESQYIATTSQGSGGNVVGFLKQKLPAPVAGQIGGLLGGAGGMVKGLGGMLGKK